MSYTELYGRLARQAAYRRAIRRRGLAALLEPYTLRRPTIPSQRTKPSGVPSDGGAPRSQRSR